MQQFWTELSHFIYPGRFVIMGKTIKSYYAIYGVTARSESSRAKKYVYDRVKNKVLVEPTDQVKMSQGNLALLDYNAGHIFNNAVIIGNGRQTDVIKNYQDAFSSLKLSLKSQSYEPDKYNTPRITGMLLRKNQDVSMAVHIVRANNKAQAHHETIDLMIKPERGYFLSTYGGPNIKPTPSFIGTPIPIDLSFENAENAAQQTYDYFTPKPNAEDLRVSVIAIETDLEIKEKSIAIINYA